MERENYLKGKIVNLEKGNTEIAAEMISNILNADIFEIVAEKEYPFNYNECIEIAKKELRENSKIKLKQDVDIKEYDTIFVGYPNWWGTVPMPVWTFLEGKDFTNKNNGFEKISFKYLDVNFTLKFSIVLFCNPYICSHIVRASK